MGSALVLTNYLCNLCAYHMNDVSVNWKSAIIHEVCSFVNIVSYLSHLILLFARRICQHLVELWAKVLS